MADLTSPDPVPEGPAVTDDDSALLEDSALELARELIGKQDSDDGEFDDVDPDPDAEPDAEAKPDAPPVDDDDDDDPLAALEAQVRQQQQQQRQQAAARAAAAAENERAVTAARAEGRTAAQTELAQRLRTDPLGVLDELGLDARQHYVTLRDHAANPQARPSPRPAAPQDFQAQVAAAVAETLRGMGVAVPAARPPAQAQDAPPEDAQHEAAKAAFVSLAGDVDRFPLLSDLDPEERARIGVLAATRRLTEGRSGDGDLEQVAQEAEELLQRRIKRQAAKIAAHAGKKTGGTGEGKAQQGSERSRQPAQRTSAPRTLTPDLASTRARVTSYPDGIEPEEKRVAAAMAIAREARLRK